MPRAAPVPSIGFIMSATSGAPSRPPPVTQTREFWVLMADAVALGIFGACAGLVFAGVTGFGQGADQGDRRQAAITGGYV